MCTNVQTAGFSQWVSLLLLSAQLEQCKIDKLCSWIATGTGNKNSVLDIDVFILKCIWWHGMICICDHNYGLCNISKESHIENLNTVDM